MILGTILILVVSFGFSHSQKVQKQNSEKTEKIAKKVQKKDSSLVYKKRNK